jgi:hypothetical protein
MPAEEECTIRPSGIGAAFFYLIGLIHLIPGFRCKDNWFQVSGVRQIAHSQEAGKLKILIGHRKTQMYTDQKAQFITKARNNGNTK